MSPHTLLTEKSFIQFWHHPLCHVSDSTLQTLLYSNKLACNNSKMSICDSCYVAKSHRKSFTLSSNKATKPLHGVHCDV
jgi:GAG-pre-integrase domain